jgi:hypothetical protein
MHDVQTLTRLVDPPTVVRTRWMLGFQRRRVRRCEWEIELPKPGPLPQISQVAGTAVSFNSGGVMGGVASSAHTGVPGYAR